VMLRFAPADPHPESYDLLRDALSELEVIPPAELEALGFRVLWRLVSALGFAPELDACVRDGSLLPAEGGLAFSTREGGALCPACAKGHGATQLPADARADLGLLMEAHATLPRLDRRHAESHRRLLARYIRYHLGEGAELPALEFWLRRPWMAA
jgi:recombinational DNA repair protein (RecF pathway)